MRSPCNPLCLDLLMWSIANRASLFRKVRLTDSGGHVVAAMPIAKNDIVCYIPSQLIMSIDKLKDVSTSNSGLAFGNTLNIRTVAEELPWWPGVTRGHFALLSLMATLRLNVDGKGGGHSAHLNLLTQQEEVLFESELVDAAADAIDSAEFDAAVDPVLQATHKDVDEIRRQILDCFVAFERRSVVVFGEDQQQQEKASQKQQSSSFGLPSYEDSEFVRAAARGEENGVVRGLVPIIDLCTHCSSAAATTNNNETTTTNKGGPTCTIGFPDAQICHWLAMERGVKAPTKDAMLLQAVRDIREGEYLTVDRGQMMGIDTETEFPKWFGFDY